ncbi:hypothetical protein PHMEG_00032760 [Phytophthora megakarya]|uniref:Uncharacterized protein n=1 Tax=Phytophthora megakarya TaxID=4795 RepID=A0A225UVB1_9STRA|nr:hypothetical protein PHMEG_00032760 [Phytophthora megakarya]
MSTFIEHLKTVVNQGDYGEQSYPLAKIKARLNFSKDRYVFGAFSWKQVTETKAPALLFVGTCNAVAGFPQQEAYVWKTEYWLQTGNRESPVHVDHGRVVSYLPTSARYCFKIWVFSLRRLRHGVMIQRPGDVICLNNLVFHSVILIYNKGTAPVDKWCGIFGDLIVHAEDRLDSFRYATKVPSGSKKASRVAWESLLSAYSVMETGDYDPANYEEEQKKLWRSCHCLLSRRRCVLEPTPSGTKRARWGRE